MRKALVILGTHRGGLISDRISLVREAKLKLSRKKMRIEIDGMGPWEFPKSPLLDGKRLRGLSQREIEDLIRSLPNGRWSLGGTLGWAYSALKESNLLEEFEVYMPEEMSKEVWEFFKEEGVHVPEEHSRYYRRNLVLLSTGKNILVETEEKVMRFSQLILSSPKNQGVLEGLRAPLPEEGVVVSLGSRLEALKNILERMEAKFVVYDFNRKITREELEKAYETLKGIKAILLFNQTEAMGVGNLPYPGKDHYVLIKAGVLLGMYNYYALNNNHFSLLSVPAGSVKGNVIGKGDRFATLLAAFLYEEGFEHIDHILEKVQKVLVEVLNRDTFLNPSSISL